MCTCDKSHLRREMPWTCHVHSQANTVLQGELLEKHSILKVKQPLSKPPDTAFGTPWLSKVAKKCLPFKRTRTSLLHFFHKSIKGNALEDERRVLNPPSEYLMWAELGAPSPAFPLCSGFYPFPAHPTALDGYPVQEVQVHASRGQQSHQTPCKRCPAVRQGRSSGKSGRRASSPIPDAPSAWLL